MTNNIINRIYLRYFYYRIEIVYSLVLKFFRNKRKYPLITYNEIKTIKEIERCTYPEELLTYLDATNVKEFANCCGAVNEYQIYYLLYDNWYTILLLHHNCMEIVDVADKRQKCPEILKVVKFIIANFGNKKIVTEAKEDTSYPILLKLSEKRRINILSDVIDKRDGTIFHKLTMKVTKRNSSTKSKSSTKTKKDSINS